MTARRKTRWLRVMAVFGGAAAIAAGLPSCVTPPRNPDDLCSIFTQKPGWYRTTLEVQQRWGIDQSTQMAVMFQESSFRAQARPPRKKLLGFIPWTRRSSAYGYAQAVDTTWNLYRKSTAKPRARRDRFGDAAEFMGWYMNRVANRARIDKATPGPLYLAYHEGAGGFSRGTHRKKPWLLGAANRVTKRTTRYRGQLAQCRAKLESARSWWHF